MISSELNKLQVTLTSATQAIPVNFYFFTKDELLVLNTSASDGSNVTLTLNTDYTVTGAGNESGGTVTMVSGTVGDTVTIMRKVPATQNTDYTFNGAFTATSHESALDKLTMRSQQIEESISRAIRLRKDELGSDSFELPSLGDRKGKLLRFNATTGNPEAEDISVIVTDGDLVVASTKAGLESVNTSDLADGQLAVVRGRSFDYDGGEGYFFLDKSGDLGASAEDGGTIYAASGGTNWYWRRKITDHINLKWWGAVGDDTTNDTDAIRNCFAALKANITIPRRLFVPSGTYRIVFDQAFSGSIDGFGLFEVPNGTTMFGEGMTLSVFNSIGHVSGSSPENPYNTFELFGDTTILDIHFKSDADRNNYAYQALDNGFHLINLNNGGLTTARNYHISRCKFSDTGNQGVHGNGVNVCFINECVFEYTGNGGANISANHLTFTNNYIYHCEGFEGAQGDSSASGGFIRIDNNIFRKPYGAGISAGGWNSDNVPATAMSVCGNTIDLSEHDSSTTYDGIVIAANWAHGKVIGNYIRGPQSGGAVGAIGLNVAQTANRGFKNILISDTIIFDFYQGLTINGGDGVDTSVVKLLGNDIHATGSTALDCVSGLHTVIARGNSFVTDANNACIELGAGTGCIYDISPTSNYFKTASADMRTVNPNATASSGYYQTNQYDLWDSAMGSDIKELVRTWNGSGSTSVGWWKQEMAGKMYWGGGGTFDTTLYRNAADELKTDDSFEAAGSLTAGTTLSVGTNAAVGGTLTTTGNATFNGNLEMGECTWGGDHIIIGGASGIHIWVDGTTDLRIKSGSAPTSDTDGTVVGTQT